MESQHYIILSLTQSADVLFTYRVFFFYRMKLCDNNSTCARHLRAWKVKVKVKAQVFPMFCSISCTDECASLSKYHEGCVRTFVSSTQITCRCGDVCAQVCKKKSPPLIYRLTVCLDQIDKWSDTKSQRICTLNSHCTARCQPMWQSLSVSAV